MKFCYVLYLMCFSLICLPAEVRGNQDMNLTVIIYYTGTNGNARNFVEALESSGIAEVIRQKSGNLRYEYFYPAKDSETVLLIDSWDNQEALDKHHASELMPRILELRNKYDLHMRVERYIPAGKVPSSDVQFIRE